MFITHCYIWHITYNMHLRHISNDLMRLSVGLANTGKYREIMLM